MCCALLNNQSHCLQVFHAFTAAVYTGKAAIAPEHVLKALQFADKCARCCFVVFNLCADEVEVLKSVARNALAGSTRCCLMVLLHCVPVCAVLSRGEFKDIAELLARPELKNDPCACVCCCIHILCSALMAHIEDNAEEVFQSEGFSRLSEDVLLSLLDNSNLRITEVRVSLRCCVLIPACVGHCVQSLCELGQRGVQTTGARCVFVRFSHAFSGTGAQRSKPEGAAEACSAQSSLPSTRVLPCSRADLPAQLMSVLFLSTEVAPANVLEAEQVPFVLCHCLIVLLAVAEGVFLARFARRQAIA